MRYLGNKTKLIGFIEKVISKYNITGEIFADVFSGTASVGDHFKDRFKIIANDYMYFSNVISSAKLLNDCVPKFSRFRELYKTSPFNWFNERDYITKTDGFIYKNYTPIGGRMYFTKENAKKIDGIRLDIESLYRNQIFSESEYYFLLGSLLESVTKVSNTSGTYQAFFKFWEPRALKPLNMEPLKIEEKKLYSNNIVFCEDTNKLIKKIQGDIAYIDPPYTTTQYANSYHLLETIARYDDPKIFGKTGRRKNRILSNYSNKKKAIYEFEDLFRQIKFQHILLSYSNQSIISLTEMLELAKKFAVDGKVYVETNRYKEYSTNNRSYKNNGNGLKEAIIYFKKDLQINKSPLNYSGSKDSEMGKITENLPKHVGTFVDAMGGAFNVGANIVAIDNVIYNEYNKFVFEIINMIVNTPPKQLVAKIQKIVNEYNLVKKGSKQYLLLRKHYNNKNSPLLLFVLQIYSFQNMIRFNSKKKMNTPVGNNEFSGGIKERIINFRIKTPSFFLINKAYQDLKINNFPSDTIFYFDPPYLITNAEYNDGKRGMNGWDSNQEAELLKFLDNLNEKGYKFMLSNLMHHKGRTNYILCNWVKEHNYKLITLGKTGVKYKREEVIVVNYDE
ncbi:DNA adenine methylase [Lactobacillus helsingborgensis]|uniref:DNA adenine methylase n=1 Tax=Lactobacillus helsingborgensis TaxID=1218494 RepID=UPI0027417D24|nr:DNA adenine methylase [Lactobacillus helsingborgensis]WLT00925.1 DNA adenine methylase [Lactobacillus helsingborgensis]